MSREFSKSGQDSEKEELMAQVEIIENIYHNIPSEEKRQ